jgi:hypothetical protein
MGVKPRGQELVRASKAVKGIVRESSRSERARLKMKMLRAVLISCERTHGWQQTRDTQHTKLVNKDCRNSHKPTN